MAVLGRIINVEVAGYEGKIIELEIDWNGMTGIKLYLISIDSGWSELSTRNRGKS